MKEARKDNAYDHHHAAGREGGAVMTHKAERERWILDWMKQYYCADAVNQDFHKAYHQRFPEYARKETYWGAQPVAQAQRDLARMAQAGILERGPVSLGANWQPGFPKWVWSYSLAGNRK